MRLGINLIDARPSTVKKYIFSCYSSTVVHGTRWKKLCLLLSVVLLHWTLKNPIGTLSLLKKHTYIVSFPATVLLWCMGLRKKSILFNPHQKKSIFISDYSTTVVHMKSLWCTVHCTTVCGANSGLHHCLWCSPLWCTWPGKVLRRSRVSQGTRPYWEKMVFSSSKKSLQHYGARNLKTIIRYYVNVHWKACK